jgi:hypothetical protein
VPSAGGVVAGEVKPAELVEHGVDHVGHRPVVGDIGRDHQRLPAGVAELVSHADEGLLVARRQRHGTACSGERARGSCTDSSAGARDQRDLSRQRGFHGASSLLSLTLTRS